MKKNKLKFLGLFALVTFSCEYNDTNQCVGPAKEIVACPDVLIPVCGCDGKTYNNPCIAEASGVRSWTEGACH